MSQTSDAPPESRPRRRVFYRAEWFTMIGMAGLVSSLFLPWRAAPLATTKLPLPAEAIYAAKQVTLNGFSLGGWEIMVACAVICNVCVLITPTLSNRRVLSFVQGAAGLGALLIALRYVALQPGAFLGLASCLILVWGASERFRIGV